MTLAYALSPDPECPGQSRLDRLSKWEKHRMWLMSFLSERVTRIMHVWRGTSNSWLQLLKEYTLWVSWMLFKKDKIDRFYQYKAESIIPLLKEWKSVSIKAKSKSNMHEWKGYLTFPGWNFSIDTPSCSELEPADVLNITFSFTVSTSQMLLLHFMVLISFTAQKGVVRVIMHKLYSTLAEIEIFCSLASTSWCKR